MKENKKVLSMEEVLQTEKIYWVKSAQSLRKWVMMDLNKSNILKTVIVKNNGRGVRYYFRPENIDLFVKAFEEGLLTDYVKSKKN